VLMLERLKQDLRYAWRGLSRSPGFVATSVLTLAVGLGLVTAMFTIFNAYVLRPFAVRDPHTLYEIRWGARDAAGRTFSWQEFVELRGRTDLFDDVVAERTRHVSSSGTRVAVSFVSGNYFDVLGPDMALGRPLAQFDAHTAGGAPVAVLSDQLWSRLFNRDLSVLGRTIDLNGHPFVIVGILGDRFAGLDDTPGDLWVPVTMYTVLTSQDLFGAAQPHELAAIGRLRRDVRPAHAQAALKELMVRVGEGRQDARADLSSRATPAPLSLELLVVLSPVFAAFGLVLVGACANVSNVMLARANARHREIGMRLSLGATRRRIVEQLVTEGLLIAGLAAAAGLVVAATLLRVGTALFIATLPPSVAAIARVVRLDFDHRVFLFALIAAAAGCTIFALVPALHATRSQLTDALRDQVSTGVRGSSLRSGLVVSQVAVSMLLLIGAATLVRNGAALQATDLGFETGGVMWLTQRARGDSLVAPAAAALVLDPRIAALAVTSRNPLAVEAPKAPLRWNDAGDVIAASYLYASPEYFRMLGISLVSGRGFTTEESRSEAPVAIISAAGAARLWPGASPLGRTVRMPIEPAQPRTASRLTRLNRFAGDATQRVSDVTIIGVAQDIVSGSVYEGRQLLHLYLPTSPTGSHAASLLVRGRSSSTVPPDVLQEVLRTVHPDRLAFDALTLDEAVALQMYPLRAASWIGSLLGAVALALSLSGLYGVLTYTFGQRTREIGIRMALGATAAAIVRLVLGQSGRLAGIGAAIGIAVTFGVMTVLSSVIHLPNVSVVDAGAFCTGLALVMGAAALAASGPARRAARIDPAVTLRSET
jgi:predicted permease